MAPIRLMPRTSSQPTPLNVAGSFPARRGTLLRAAEGLDFRLGQRQHSRSGRLIMGSQAEKSWPQARQR
jgi:hypothetical protein